ncbi:hypothetical protein HanPSC8_Chr07g0272051 [Helianthus annuus]|nr:hypothetical protein HanPSC8_Chr07g0272051 [Helianthus annuus]
MPKSIKLVKFVNFHYFAKKIAHRTSSAYTGVSTWMLLPKRSALFSLVFRLSFGPPLRIRKYRPGG